MELILILQVTPRNLNYIENRFGYSCTVRVHYLSLMSTPYNYIVSQSYFFSNTLLVIFFFV